MQQTKTSLLSGRGRAAWRWPVVTGVMLLGAAFAALLVGRESRATSPCPRFATDELTGRRGIVLRNGALAPASDPVLGEIPADLCLARKHRTQNASNPVQITDCWDLKLTADVSIGRKP